MKAPLMSALGGAEIYIMECPSGGAEIYIMECPTSGHQMYQMNK